MASPLREQTSRLLAEYFLVHLKAELSKADDLLNHITYEGISFRQLTEEMIKEVRQAFPGIDDPPVHRRNLFRSWWQRSRWGSQYDTSTFKLYNQLFLTRLYDLREGSRASREAMIQRMHEILRVALNRNRNLTYQSILGGETLMLAELRRAISQERLATRARDILLAQNQVLSYESFQFFDRALKESLKRADDLLHTILPEPVAEELKSTGRVSPGLIQDSCVLFADMVQFASIADKMPPEELLSELDYCFSHFDRISERLQIEKIKTIGDAYMCASGLFEKRPSDPLRIALCGIRMMEFIRRYRKSRARKGKLNWDLRIGIHQGPVIAGVVGNSRFTFDIWGDTVNVASRLESTSEPHHINLSAPLAEFLSPYFVTSERGKVPVKGKGEVAMCFVDALRPEFSIGGRGRVPNKAFYEEIRRLDKRVV
ncbi:MAG: adenylate/guanylate cyclase domain-containing protein [Leptospiraceae bacterium]|nr:adenylate/guanylate cyclase domain-containing protein [Leptospiraceae bacterium]